jgi:hypothetical protein
MRLLLVTFGVFVFGCFSKPNVSQAFACTEGLCPADFVCDDGICCKPGSTPACPTLSFENTCSDNRTPQTLYKDADGDRYGGSVARIFCSPPIKEKWSATPGDCNDEKPDINPGAIERCDGVDDNCNGNVDENTALKLWLLDSDGDGYAANCDAGSCQTKLACVQPAGYAARAGDCKPDNAAISPGEPERCNGIDDNCNGAIDEPKYVDATPLTDGGKVTCTNTAATGACRNGVLKCLYDSTTSTTGPVCVTTAGPDLCGDGIDNDCSGGVDDAPFCGGPQSLISVVGGAGVIVSTITSVANVSASMIRLPPRCFGQDGGVKSNSGWTNPLWITTDTSSTQRLVHTWSATAKEGWDLTPTQFLDFAVTCQCTYDPVVSLSSTYVSDAGNGDALAPDNFSNVVVTFCGSQPGQYKRFVPTGNARVRACRTLDEFAPVFESARRLSLRNPGMWQEETSGGFDWASVRSIELSVVLNKPSGGTPNAGITLKKIGFVK